MSPTEYVVKPLPAMRLAARRTTVADPSEDSGRVEPLFVVAAEAITAAGGSLATAVAVYEQVDGNARRIVAGYTHGGRPVPTLDVVDLPAVAEALSGVHLGAMDIALRALRRKRPRRCGLAHDDTDQ